MSLAAGGLGEFASLADLTNAVRIDLHSSASNGSRGGLHLCSVVVNLVYANTALLSGAPVLVEVFGEAGHQRLSVYQLPSCNPVATVSQ
jgi:hypothetical protein